MNTRCKTRLLQNRHNLLFFKKSSRCAARQRIVVGIPRETFSAVLLASSQVATHDQFQYETQKMRRQREKGEKTNSCLSFQSHLYIPCLRQIMIAVCPFISNRKNRNFASNSFTPCSCRLVYRQRANSNEAAS